MATKQASQSTLATASTAEELTIENSKASESDSFDEEEASTSDSKSDIQQVHMEVKTTEEQEPRRLDPSTDFRLTDVRNLGLVMHYFTSGLVFGALNAALIGLLSGYLSVQSYISQTAMNVCNLPSIFIFFFGLLSDSKPIYGLRRKPYIIIGWTINVLSVASLSFWSMPPPYFCAAEDGEYQMDVPPCNPDAPEEYPRFVLFLGLMSLGTNLAGAAADALLVEYAQNETESTRGSIQSKMMTVQMVGKFVSIILAAFGFNGKLYTGSFDQRKQLSFMQYCQVLLPPLPSLAVLQLPQFVMDQNLPIRTSRFDVT